MPTTGPLIARFVLFASTYVTLVSPWKMMYRWVELMRHLCAKRQRHQLVGVDFTITFRCASNRDTKKCFLIKHRIG